jgi:PAS domain S-box-containing protein
MAGEKILIVEDEGIVARETEYRLKDLGYNICGLAASGAEAIKKADKTRPDVVLMDIMLKGEMDGIEAAEQIHSKFSIPVVYVTAHADETTLQRAKRTEPMGYLLKPFNERELHAAIEIALYKHTTEKTLKDREQLLGTTLKSIGDAVIVTDTGGAVSFMNPGAELLTRWKLKEALGKPVSQVFSVVSESTRTLVQHPVMRALAESIATTARNHILTSRGGRNISVEGTATPIVDEAGNVHGAVLVFRDVTGYRKSDDALRITQHSMDLMAEAVLRLGSDGRVLYANEAATRMLGYTWDDLVWMSMQDLDPTLKGSRWDLHMDRLKEKVGITYEASLRSGKGDPVPVEIRAHYFLFDHGEYVVALLKDIAREKAVRDGRLKEGVYAQGLIDSANVMIIGLDREGAIRTFNREVELATGYSRSSLDGKNLFEVILPISKNVSIWRSFLDWQASRLQLPVTFEAPLATKAGAKRLISWHINETRDDESVTGLVLVGVDVTDQKQMEQQLNVRNEELLSLRRVSELTLKTAAVDEVFQEIADEVASTIDYPFVAVEQYDEERQKMIFRGIKSLIPVPSNMEVPLGETLSGLAIRTGHLLVERAASKRPEYANGFLRKLGISTYICVPVIVNQRVFGALTLGHTEAADVSEQLQHYATAVANQLALFLRLKEPGAGKENGGEKLRQLLHAWPEAIITGAEGTIVSAGAAALKLFGAEHAEEIIGKELLDLVSAEHKKLLEPYLTKGAAERGPLPLTEMTMLALDGAPLDVEVAAGPVGPGDGGGVSIVMHDISKRKLEEKALQGQAEQWRNLVEGEPEGIAILKGGLYVYLNQSCAELFGHGRPEELVGTSVWVTLHPDDADLFGREQVSGRAGSRRFDFRGVRKDGNTFQGEATLIAITHQGAEATYARFSDVAARKRAEHEHNEMEDRFRTSFEVASVPLLILDQDTTILSLNQSCERLLGVRRDEVEGKKKWVELVTAEDAQRAAADARELLKEPHGILDCDYTVVGGDSVVKSVRMSMAPIPGRTESIVSLAKKPEMVEIAEPKEPARDGYRAIFEHVGSPAFVADRNTTIFSVNEEFEKLSALSKEELEGKKSWRDFVVKEDLSGVEEYLKLLVGDPDQAPRRHDLKVLSRDGAIKDVRLTASTIPDSDRFVFTLIDMRERKWAEQAWLESEKKYRHVVDNVQEGIWVLDSEGSTTFVSQRMAEMLKYDSDEMVGKRFFLFSDVKNAERAGQKWERCKQGIKEGYEADFIAKDGKPVHTKLTSAPIFGDADTFRGAMFSVTDISESRATEEKIKASLQEKEVLLRETHHRVKNNLQVVSSLLYLQSKNISDPQMLEVLMESLERVRSIALIHEQLYKSEDLAHVDFKEYLNSLTTNLLQTYGAHSGGVKMKVEIDERVSLTVDKAIPCGLIVNELVSNALRHAFVGRAQGTIFIELRQNEDGTASLVVGDDGTGLPPHVDFKYTPSLGLQLVNTLVNQLGGTMQLTRKGGTVFTVTFS